MESWVDILEYVSTRPLVSCTVRSRQDKFNYRNLKAFEGASQGPLTVELGRRGQKTCLTKC